MQGGTDMEKYYITRTDLITGAVSYKKNKTVDGWAGEGFKPYCWRFSKQGARSIVARLTSAQQRSPYMKERYLYGIELVKE